MERCEVLIVGGGPAGSSCARALVQHGVDVLVMDKREFPRDKVCAGWVTPPVMTLLDVDLTDYAQSRTLQPIRAFRSGMLDDAMVDTDYDETVSYGIRRCEFDDYLLRRSAARLRLGEAVNSIERQHGTWRINGEIEAKLLIGAGGHFCPVAKTLHNSLGSEEPAVTAQEAEFEMPEAQARACRIDPDRPELLFLNDLSGYAWCVRKGNFLNVGLGSEDNHRLSERTNNFVDKLIAQGRLHPDTPRKFKGHAYLLYPTAPRPLFDEGVMLIGDAAGLAYAQSGEGIRPAVEAGLLAAQTFIDSHGDSSRAALAAYGKRIEQRLGPRGTPAAPPPWLNVRLKRRIAPVLMRSRWFTRRVLLDKWFLRRHEPALTPRPLV